MAKAIVAGLAVLIGCGMAEQTAATFQLVGVVGGVVRVEVPDSTSEVSFLGKPQLLLGSSAVLAIPLGTESGLHEFTVIPGEPGRAFGVVEVVAKDYPKEYITIEDEEQVSPSAKTLKRISRESQLMRTAYARFTAHPQDIVPLVLPAEGRKSGVFGSQRFFNNQPRKPHSGLDIAAPVGTPIKSPAPGVVVVTGHFFFNGNTVMIDHGGGLVSMMCHMESISVQEGHAVERGSILGTIGTTGRSTGPHLHWSTSLQGERIDPEDLMRVVNSSYDGSASGGEPADVE